MAINPLESFSNKTYDFFGLSNKFRISEYKGYFNNKNVTEKNAVILTGDVTIAENYAMSSNTSSYPVYKEADITDHSRPADFMVSMTCVSSDASMSYFDTFSSLNESALSRFASEGEGQPGDGTKSKPQEIFAQLNKWWRVGQPLAIDCVYDVDGFKEADGTEAAFLIQNISVPRTSEIGSRAIKWNITLKKVKFAKALKTDVSLYSYTKGVTDAQLNEKSRKMGKGPIAEKEVDSLVKQKPGSPDRTAVGLP